MALVERAGGKEGGGCVADCSHGRRGFMCEDPRRLRGDGCGRAPAILVDTFWPPPTHSELGLKGHHWLPGLLISLS